jgi:N-6 DNA Methylase
VNNTREIVKLFEKIERHGYDRYTTFTDCMAMMASSISNSVDLRHRDQREASYMEIVGRYDRKVVDLFPKIMAETALALDPPSDVLGQTFHELELHNKARGQFFTPYDLSYMMARMTLGDDLIKEADEKGYITVHEPAAGSGSMVIALADVMHSRGVNPQQQLHVTAIDVDGRAAHMAYTQLSLLHIPAAVYVGNTLSMEMRDVWYTPAHILGGWGPRLRYDQEHGREQAPDVTVEPDPELIKQGQQELFQVDGGGGIKPLGLGPLRMPEARFEPKPLSRCHSSARCPSCLHQRVVQRCRVRGVDRQVRTSPTHRRCPHIRSIRRS